jgi:hypothetical protein
MTGDVDKLTDGAAADVLAMLELTDANVSPEAEGAWDAAMADVREVADVDAKPCHEAVSDMVVEAGLFG